MPDRYEDWDIDELGKFLEVKVQAGVQLEHEILRKILDQKKEPIGEIHQQNEALNGRGR